MPFKKGEKRPIAAGKKKGTPNKATSQARDAIASFVEGNVERLNGWLDRIAIDDPKDAFNCFMSVVEYHIPKLARQEVSGINGAPLEVKDVTKSDEDIIKQYINQNKGKK